MENTILKFIEQHLYIGIDVHKKNWTVTLIMFGLYLKTFSMNPDPGELVEHLKRNYPGAKYHTVYEAGFCGFWIDRELRKAGVDNIVVNAADVPTTNKAKRRKTDRIDSKKLAKELSVNNLTGIYIPDERSEAIRNLSRARVQLTKDQTRWKNRIKSMLYFTGVKFPGNEEMQHWSGKFIKHLTELEFAYKEKRETLDIYLKSLENTRKELVAVVKELRSIAQEDEKIKKIIGHLVSVPGIGFITAITLYTELMDIKRFPKFDRLASYVGLSPDTSSSGESEQVTGITQRQQKYLRSLLVEAAWMAVRKDPAMTAAYGVLSKKMGSQKAIVRIAKKLLSRIMYVWSNEKDYVLSVAA